MAKTLRTTENLCPCCREIKSKGSFYPAIGIQFQDRVPICKECCQSKYDRYTAVLGEDGGGWVLLSELGIPYIADRWKNAKNAAKISATKTKSNNVDYFFFYIKSLKDSGVVYQGFWESDTTYDQIVGKGIRDAVIKDDITDLTLMRKKWGKYDDPEAYEFLEETLTDYTEDLLNMDANLLNRYKDLCRAEYAKYKAQESGDLTEQSKALDAVAKQLKLMRLDDFQDNKQSDIDKFIERKAWTIENVRPAECEELEKYRDFSGFEKTWEHITRGLRNLIAGTKDYPTIPKENS